MKSDAYEEGVIHKSQGGKRENPYDLHTQERRDWQEGYDDMAVEMLKSIKKLTTGKPS